MDIRDYLKRARSSSESEAESTKRRRDDGSELADGEVVAGSQVDAVGVVWAWSRRVGVTLGCGFFYRSTNFCWGKPYNDAKRTKIIWNYMKPF